MNDPFVKIALHHYAVWASVAGLSDLCESLGNSVQSDLPIGWKDEEINGRVFLVKESILGGHGIQKDLLILLCRNPESITGFDNYPESFDNGKYSILSDGTCTISTGILDLFSGFFGD